MLTKVWNPGTRSFADEAWRCYNAGALRATIAATWTAITADAISKIELLADEGDKDAAEMAHKVELAQRQGLSAEGVRAMQSIEAQLLDMAQTLEIIDAIDKRSLERIREDRNLCVHPSLRPFSEEYQPTPEVARAHLAVALDVLLTHRPTQGRRILALYEDFTCSASFVPTVTHIQSAYFDRVRSATRRNIVVMAAKHAALELDPNGRLDPIRYAERSAQVLEALALRDRSLVRDSVVALRDRFRTVAADVQRRALGRLGNQDFFWDMLDHSLVDQMNSLVAEAITTPESERLGAPTAATLSLVAVEEAREKLPALVQQNASLSLLHQANVAEARPNKYFVPTVIALLRRAYSFRFGEQVGALLIAHAGFLTTDDLAAALLAWAGNEDCRRAAAMPDAAVELLHRTSYLGPERAVAFEEFLTTVRTYYTDPDDDYYRYPGLEQALAGLNM